MIFQAIEDKVEEGRNQDHRVGVNSGDHKRFSRKLPLTLVLMTSGQLPSSSQNRLTRPARAVSTCGSFGYDGEQGRRGGRRENRRESVEIQYGSQKLGLLFNC